MTFVLIVNLLNYFKIAYKQIWWFQLWGFLFFKMADVTSRPDKVVGMHFFAPAHIMKLLENIRGRRTSPETIATAMDVGKRINKVWLE